MHDYVYYYDKETFTRKTLGEIQKDFNMSFVIDGTKDSAKVTIINYDSVEIEPNIIVKHEATNTYWIVSHDKVTRYKKDTDYLYTHELELNGAIELLNARDLTDCGFNQNKYTIETFIKRLLTRSNFEFNKQYDLSTPNEKGYRLVSLGGAISFNKKVDYVKTFENYTPLSALREFLDGYNCNIKLSFEEINNKLTIAILDIVSKTGKVNSPILEESVFREVEEIKTIDKNSFGTTVISNAQNVISTKAKTYPSSGLVKPTGKQYEFNGRNGTMVVRLPSPAYKVNWVDMATKTKFTIIQKGHYTITETFNPFDDESVKRAFGVIQDQAESWGILNEFNANVNINMLKEVGYQRFYYEDNYDPISKQFISDNYIPIRSAVGLIDEYKTVLSNKEMKDNVDNKDDVFYCDRGSDLIDGFTFFGDTGITLNKIDFKAHNERIVYSVTTGGYTYYVILGDFTIDANQEPRITKQEYYIPDLGFSINYIPMSDIKIKLDNSGTRKDSQLYNQNGKLTDSVALSKSLLSYSKEIESDNITKYADFYYKFYQEYGQQGQIESTIPQIGQLVDINDELYVINNISLDFFENEDFDYSYGREIQYYVKGEFTLSKNIATKSLMVNPNQNIRDYGIPQNFNVKRKQLYRDFYELTYTQESSELYYSGRLTLDKVLNLGYTYEPYVEHTAVIMVTFDNAYGGSPSQYWYYQLESTTFVLKKSIYEVIDFKDNNIIGYGSQNIWSGFNISRVIDGGYDLVNTPISYVDAQGEVKGIQLCFCTNEQLTEAYNDYISENPSASGKYSAFYSCFIPQYIHAYVERLGHNDFIINESAYNKDATEVPVFEYVCQIDDSGDVLVGSNILDTNDNDAGYVYLYALAPKGQYNDNNFENLNIQNPTLNRLNVINATNVADLQYGNGEILIKLYESIEYDLISGTKTFGNEVDLDSIDYDNYDLVIVRWRAYEDELENIFTTSFTLKTDAHSTALVSIKRDNTWIVDNYEIARSTTYSKNDCLSIDQYVYSINVDSGYALDGMQDYGSGDLRDGSFYLEVKTKPISTQTVKLYFTANRKLAPSDMGGSFSFGLGVRINGGDEQVVIVSYNGETHTIVGSIDVPVFGSFNWRWLTNENMNGVYGLKSYKFSGTSGSGTVGVSSVTVNLTNIGRVSGVGYSYRILEQGPTPPWGRVTIDYNGNTILCPTPTTSMQNTGSLASTGYITDIAFKFATNIPFYALVEFNSRFAFPTALDGNQVVVYNDYLELTNDKLDSNLEISLKDKLYNAYLHAIFVVPN